MFPFFEINCDSIATVVHPDCPIQPSHINTDRDLWLESHNLTDTFGGDYRLSSRIRDLVLIFQKSGAWEIADRMIADFNHGKREAELTDPAWLIKRGALIQVSPGEYQATQNLVVTLYLLAPATKLSSEIVTVIHLFYVQWKMTPPTSGSFPISKRVLCGREKIPKTALDPTSKLIVATLGPENLKIQYPLDDRHMCPECLEEALRLSREGKFEGYDCVYVYTNAETIPRAKVA
jgi:hypothetical protein